MGRTARAIVQDLRARMPGVFGTVSSISGSTITVSSKGWQRGGPNGSSTPAVPAMTYTVDASNAVVIKNGATSTISSVVSGDMIAVEGTVSGSNVTAKVIRDGFKPGANPMNGKIGMGGMGMGARGALPQGNGQPVIGGSISTINGTSLTVTTKSNIVYNVDASVATVTKGNATSSVSSLTVGDDVIVQGAVNDTSVSASSVIDRGAAKTPSSNLVNSQPGKGIAPIFKGIGDFFHGLFGFF